VEDIDLRNIFGTSVTTAYVKVVQAALTNIGNSLCKAFAKGFGLSADAGNSVHSYFRTEGHPESTQAFNKTPYTTYESEYVNILTSFLPSTVSSTEINVLAWSAQALVFSYVINSSIEMNDFRKIMGQVLERVAIDVLGRSLFETADTEVITPFTNDVIETLMGEDYSKTIAYLNSDSRIVEAPLVNYNWYDTSQIFAEPNLTLMKDIENQYYYISGKMFFEGAFGTLDPCIEDTVTIKSWSGDVSFSYIRNSPCRDESSYIGPTKYVDFKRVFNDGPMTSGHLTDSLLTFYINNDKAQLNKLDYLSNNYTLTNYTGEILAPAFIDANGQYGLSSLDYLYAQTSKGCDIPYQRMHIGDNFLRYICDDAKTCICPLSNVTGFKFVSLELPDEIWNYNWQFRQTNPISDVSRIRKRALNVSDNPYVATDAGNSTLLPYFEDLAYNQYWYVGYPVLNGTNSLPQLAFHQTFKSQTFNQNAEVAMYPSISNAFGNSEEGGESYREASISDWMLFSGSSDVPVKFEVNISSNLSGKDTISQKFFGMGTAFSGKYDVVLTEEENAGFMYSGFTVSQNGIAINSLTLADSFLPSTIGRAYKTFKYISGYKSLLDGTVYNPANQFAKNSTGDLLTYAYFKQSDVPTAKIQETKWSYFAEVPSELDSSPNYERLYGEQIVENYLPRFYDGPFSIETRKFLYPNASAADKAFQGKRFGIPTGLTFKVRVREEAVKEIYGKYTIHPDGTISEIEHINVIRSDTRFGRTKNPIMTYMFVPDSPADQFDYNFIFWDKKQEFSNNAPIGDMVDNNWAPIFNLEYVPLGKNNTVYDGSLSADSLFKNGCKKTSNSKQQHIVYSKDSSYTFYSRASIKDGLFHSFKLTNLTGAMTYTLPIFDLGINDIIVNKGMLQAFPELVQYQNLLFYRFNGYEGRMNTGVDTLFLKTIGGRRGGPTATKEGGYHPKDIVGDRWNGVIYDVFGVSKIYCMPDGASEPAWEQIRSPGEDVNLLLFNTATSGTDVWTNGMYFTPYRINKNTNLLTNNMAYPFAVNGNSGYLEVESSGEFISFELSKYFILRDRKTVDLTPEWYYETGFSVGPFDRDVEIGLVPGQYVGAYSDFYINGKQLSHWFLYGYNCERDWVTDVGIDRGIQCGEPSYANPRNSKYTILSVIPAGETALINILSNPDVSKNPDNYPVDVVFGDDAWTHVGMASGVKLSLRTHRPAYSYDYDSSIDTGEAGRFSTKLYVDNGLQKKFHINHPNGLVGLGGMFVFENYGYTGKLYPKPDDEEFAKMSSKDSYGNVTYQSSDTPENYWRSYAIRSGIPITFSGYREGSRIALEIFDIEFKFDKIDYQSYKLVTPSGNCKLSGEMGYFAQADNTIFSEGVYLKNATYDDILAETYNPSFVSEVLRRVPSSLFQFPVQTKSIEPVLQAPSIMMERLNKSGIFEGQKYSYLLKTAPDNYNKLWWPALSDLETLNPGETIEAIAPGDGNTFTNSTMLFSASQGQELPNGIYNPNISKQYSVQAIFQMYDSTTTDALINSGLCITSGRGPKVVLSQSELSGALAARGTPISFIANGLV
jgi:hypothetical protein